MSARSLFLSAAVCVGLASPLTVAAVEEPVSSEAVETAKNSFPGIVNANAVFVRCGPAESYYATSKIEKNAKVTVVGIRMDWLKIVPPEGSFCYVAKAFVEKRGDGSVGRITKDSVNVRAGSTLNNLKVVPLCQLTQGQDVQIIGEQEEYFKIKPPEKAFLYVNKQFVDPDPAAAPKPIEQVATRPPTPPQPQPPVPPPPVDVAPQPPTPPAGNNPTPEIPGPTPPVAPEAPTPPASLENGGNTPIAGTPTTNPAQAAVPTTKPAEVAAETEQLFDKTETEFAATSGKPIEQQPITELTKAYEQLAASTTLAPTLHRVIDSRLGTLRLRADIARQLNEAHVAQAAIKQRQVALQAERQELEERMAATGVATYTAVGTLQPSSLQLGSQTLYRLTDPANGRTVIYLRSSDGKFVSYLGKFIGVKGEIANEPGLSLRVISPTDAALVDPAKVNKGVASQVIPPSMLQLEASTDQRP